MTLINRRRFLTISAVCVAWPAGMASAQTAQWRGTALGASTQMQIVGLGQTQADPVFAKVEAELRRLEAVFSLFQDSQLTRLNRDGRLVAPSLDLLKVLSLSSQLNAASQGAFDPTVQPLWIATAQQADVEAAANLVGWHMVHFDSSEVGFERKGMGLTLNGIAQGYITDQIVALMTREGFGDVLMDMGEIAALGHRADGAAWRAGISQPDGTIVERVSLRDRALATSAPSGTKLEGMSSHILHPKGASQMQALASVSADQAAVADGLSTALCLMSPQEGADMVAQFSGAKIEVLV